jgi:hypothetical protein
MARAVSIRRIFGPLAAAACLAGAQVLAGRVRESSRLSAQAEAIHRAQSARGAVHDALAGALKDLEAQASAAASLSPIKSLAGSPDRKTIEDALQSEDWWRAQRGEFAASGLFFDPPDQDAVVGALAAAPPAELIARARSSRSASAVITLNGTPALAGAAVIDIPVPSGVPPVMGVAKALDAALLKSIAQRAREPLAISDGKLIRATSGDDALALEKLAGREGERAIVVEPSGAWVAASEPIARGLFLWTLAATGDLFAQAERASSSTLVIVWALASFAAIAILVVTFRRAATEETESLLRQTTAQLEAARAQLSRLTPAASGASATAEATELAPPLESTSLRRTPASGLAPTAQTPSRDEASFGRFHLVERLGAGGMGQVHLAVAFGAEGFKRAFVVKRMRAELLREPELVKQFIDEARLGARLVHSNIVAVFDFGKVGEELFLAQEYVNGRDLDRLITRSLQRRGTPLSPAVALHAAHAVLQALSFAHSLADEGGRPLGLVHRDVSPHNVLVSVRGEVKLLDFGIVKAEGRATETQHGTVKGNVYCMAPEQARGHAVDARADLFSFATTLYRCLSREPLYGKGTTPELLVRAARGPTPFDLAKVRALPSPFGSVLERALQPDPEARFATAAAFAAALPQPCATAATEAGALVEELFGRELAAERAHLAQVSTASAAAAALP